MHHRNLLLPGLHFAVLILASGCRFEGPGPVEGSLEYRLTNESWSVFSELFSSDRGYRVAFLPFNIVANEGGRMSETWHMGSDSVLTITNSLDHDRRFRWFNAAALFAHCREGYAKPFFIAADSLTSSEVFASAREARIAECSPATILRIAGGLVTWSSADTTRVELVDLSNHALTRQDRTAIRDIEFIETLDLSGSRLSNADLGYVARLASLTNLALGRNPITDDGLKHLVGLPLVRLDLSSTGVTDEGLTRLGGIQTLKVLYIGDTAITSRGIDSLSRLLPELVVQM